MTKTIYAALAKAQATMTGAAKASDNPHFRSKYANLGAVQDACLPALHANGFAVYQPLVTDEQGYWVETVLAHESGDILSCRIPLLLGKHDMQGLGSAITYARRYGLFCMSGVAPEDDDGNEAAAQGGKQPPRRTAAPEGATAPAPTLESDIKKIRGIWDDDELTSFYKVSREINADRANHPDFVRACQEQKAAILAKMKGAAQ